MGKEEREALVEKTMEEMGLRESADTPVGNWHLRGLSGGGKRRVSIALEILTRPKILFLDEPTSGLDRYVYLANYLSIYRSCPALEYLQTAGIYEIPLTGNNLMMKLLQEA